MLNMDCSKKEKLILNISNRLNHKNCKWFRNNGECWETLFIFDNLHIILNIKQQPTVVRISKILFHIDDQHNVDIYFQNKYCQQMDLLNFKIEIKNTEIKKEILKSNYIQESLDVIDEIIENYNFDYDFTTNLLTDKKINKNQLNDYINIWRTHVDNSISANIDICQTIDSDNYHKRSNIGDTIKNSIVIGNNTFIEKSIIKINGTQYFIDKICHESMNKSIEDRFINDYLQLYNVKTNKKLLFPLAKLINKMDNECINNIDEYAKSINLFIGDYLIEQTSDSNRYYYRIEGFNYDQLNYNIIVNVSDEEDYRTEFIYNIVKNCFENDNAHFITLFSIEQNYKINMDSLIYPIFQNDKILESDNLLLKMTILLDVSKEKVPLKKSIRLNNDGYFVMIDNHEEISFVNIAHIEDASNSNQKRTNRFNYLIYDKYCLELDDKIFKYDGKPNKSNKIIILTESADDSITNVMRKFMIVTKEKPIKFKLPCYVNRTYFSKKNYYYIIPNNINNFEYSDDEYNCNVSNIKKLEFNYNGLNITLSNQDKHICTQCFSISDDPFKYLIQVENPRKVSKLNYWGKVSLGQKYMFKKSSYYQIKARYWSEENNCEMILFDNSIAVKRDLIELDNFKKDKPKNENLINSIRFSRSDFKNILYSTNKYIKKYIHLDSICEICYL